MQYSAELCIFVVTSILESVGKLFAVLTRIKLKKRCAIRSCRLEVKSLVAANMADGDHVSGLVR